MKTSKHYIFVATLALVLMTSLMPLQAIDTNILQKETVVIRNDNSGEKITIQCYSSDDKLGVHTLSYGANFTFGFRATFTTKFYCDFTTSHGSGNYGVYTSGVETKCNEYCLWLVKANGPCLEQAPDKSLYCQAWKIPPKGFTIN